MTKFSGHGWHTVLINLDKYLHSRSLHKWQFGENL